MANDKRPPLTIPRPVELAGMRARLLRAQGQQKDIAATGKAYDDVMDGIDEAHKAIKGHVGDLRLVESSLRSTIESMVDRSNGAPPDGESDGRQSSSDQANEGGGQGGQVDPKIDAKPQVETPKVDVQPPGSKNVVVNNQTDATLQVSPAPNGDVTVTLRETAPLPEQPGPGTPDAAATALPQVSPVAVEPEHLTVNGVQAGS
jgi:hypothetical protein